MKIEISGGAVPTLMVCTLILAILIISVSAMVMHCYEVRQYTAHGYTRETLPGASCVHWVKGANQ